MTFATGDIDPRRVEVVTSLWAPLVDGVVFVSDRAPVLPALDVTLLWAAPAHRFSRSSWRNIGVRVAPDGWIVVFDIDVVPVLPTARDLVAPQKVSRCGGVIWLDASATEAVLAGAQPGSGNEGGEWSGIVAGRRLDLVTVSWDDSMVYWGAEDEDFYLRAAETIGIVPLPRAVAHLQHEHRQTLGRREQLRRNRAAAGPGREPSQWAERAWREILMSPPGQIPLSTTPRIEWTSEAEARRHAASLVWRPRDTWRDPPVSGVCSYVPLQGCVVYERCGSQWRQLYRVLGGEGDASTSA